MEDTIEIPIRKYKQLVRHSISLQHLEVVIMSNMDTIESTELEEAQQMIDQDYKDWEEMFDDK